MYGLFKQLQTYNAVCGQKYDGFCIWSREIHGGFLDSLTELPVLLAQCGQRPVQIVLGNVPHGAFGTASVRLECP